MSASFSDEDQDNSPLADPKIFMSMLGSLIYLLKTRSDILFSVNRLATRSHRCTEKDYSAVKRVLRYVIGTKELGITFNSSDGIKSIDKKLSLFAWCDAAFQMHSDSKSHGGYCLSFSPVGNGMFFARSFKQSVVTLSACESELNSAVIATTEIMWVNALLIELGVNITNIPILFVDNKSMITLSTNYSGNHKKVKHFLRNINFMMEKVEKLEVLLVFVETINQISDTLTKALSELLFNKHNVRLMGMKLK
jgi:hypothetical protein